MPPPLKPARTVTSRARSRRIHAAIACESWDARQALTGAVGDGVGLAAYPALTGLMDAATRAWTANSSARHFTYAGKRYRLTLSGLDRLIVSDAATGQDLVGKFVGYWF